MTSTAGRRRPAAPEPPSGEIVVQAPPEIEDHESSSGVLTSAIPMLGSLGSVAVMATMGSPTSAGQERSLLAAGMFLVATVAFVLAQLDRQRTTRLRRADAARTAYLRHLGTVRAIARRGGRPAARRDGVAAPRPRRPSRRWPRNGRGCGSAPSPTASSCRCGTACAASRSRSTSWLQAPRRWSGSIRQRPRRCTGCSPYTGSSRTCRPPSTCGPSTGSRSAAPRRRPASLARSMICSAAAFQSPGHLAIAVLASERDAGRVGLGEVAAPRALGPRAPMPSARAGWSRPTSPSSPRSCRPTPTSCWSSTAARCRPVACLPRDGRYGVTVLELPDRWDELDDGARLRLLLDDRAAPADGRPPIRALSLHEPEVRARPTSATSPPPRPSPAGSLRCTSAPVSRSSRRSARGITDFMDLLGLPDVRRLRPGRRLALPPRARPAAGADRARRRRRADPPRPQGVRPARDGSARPRDRRDRLRQVGAPPHPRARPGADPLARGAEHGAGRLQGRRDLRRDVGAAPRLGRDHQPRRRARPGRPHAGRAVRRDGAPPGGPA